MCCRVSSGYVSGGPSLFRLLWLPMSFRRLDLDALWLSDLQVSEGTVRVWGVMVSEGRVC